MGDATSPVHGPTSHYKLAMKGRRGGQQTALMEGSEDVVGYWLTPPEDIEALVAEFGELFDPVPYPRPAGWDGLKEDWIAEDGVDRVCYVNPPFEGPNTSFSGWARKCVEQVEKGRTVVLIYPVLSWLNILLRAGSPDDTNQWILTSPNARVEVRPIGTRQWVRPDGKGRKSPSPLCYFILRPRRPE